MAAARVARSAPREWEAFLGALSEYSTMTTTNCIQSALDELPRAQGRAQAVARMAIILRECLVRADKIESKKK